MTETLPKMFSLFSPSASTMARLVPDRTRTKTEGHPYYKYADHICGNLNNPDFITVLDRSILIKESVKDTLEKEGVKGIDFTHTPIIKNRKLMNLKEELFIGAISGKVTINIEDYLCGDESFDHQNNGIEGLCKEIDEANSIFTPLSFDSSLDFFMIESPSNYHTFCSRKVFELQELHKWKNCVVKPASGRSGRKRA